MTPAADLIFNFSLLIPECYQAPYTKYGPGQLVLKMSPKRRAVLQALKSEDLRDIRPDLVFIPTGRATEFSHESHQRIVAVLS